MSNSALSQEAIQKFLLRLNTGESEGFSEAASVVLRTLVGGLDIDQAAIWLVDVDRLTASNIYSKTDGSLMDSRLYLDPMDSTQIVLNFMTHGEGAIWIGREDSDFQPSLDLTNEFHTNLAVSLQSRGKFPGFLVLQSKECRSWSEEDRSTLETVGAVLAAVTSYELDIKRLAKASGMT